MNNIPAFYDMINTYNSAVSPSTVHVSNTGLARYFRKYLLQKAMSVFKWEVPETWSLDYMLYTLYCYGYISIINTNKFGVIPQQCGLSGYDIFYRPNRAIVSNALFNKIYDLKIGTQCTILKLQPDYSSIMDIVSFYADLMALTSETCATNILNSKLSYVFTAKDKTSGEAMKKLYDNVSSGQPSVVIDKNLMNSNGEPNWLPFTQNVGQNFIGDKLLAVLDQIEDQFNTQIGIPNANTQKKERLISAEVEANEQEVHSNCSLWLEQLQESCKKASEMFGIKLSVDWRVKPSYDGGKEEKKDGKINTGADRSV